MMIIKGQKNDKRTFVIYHTPFILLICTVVFVVVWFWCHVGCMFHFGHTFIIIFGVSVIKVGLDVNWHRNRNRIDFIVRFKLSDFRWSFTLVFNKSSQCHWIKVTIAIWHTQRCWFKARARQLGRVFKKWTHVEFSSLCTPEDLNRSILSFRILWKCKGP